MSPLERVLRERFPSAKEVEAEAAQPVPEWRSRKGGAGLTRFEVLVAQARRAEPS